MASGYIPGKFARFYLNGIGAVSGPYRWAPSMKRERLDTTNFESAVGPSGNNVFSEGDVGIFDTTFTVETWISAVNCNMFYPDATLICSLFYRKSSPLGYVGLVADVLEFSPNVGVREMEKATVNMQTSGLVLPAG